MRFIPQRLKKLFSRKARKGEAAAEVPAEAAAPAEAAPAPAAEPAPPPAALDPLIAFKTPEGYYAIDVTIRPSLGKAPNNQHLHWISNRDIGFELVTVGSSPLAGCKTIATQLEEHLIKKFDIDIGQVYFKVQTPPPALMDFYVQGYEQTIGLRPGITVTALLVPEDCAWTPRAELVAPRQDVIPGTGIILSESWTLLKQYVPRYNWQTMYVNGLDIMTPQPMQIPGAAPAVAVNLDAPEAEQAAQAAVEKTTATPAPVPAPETATATPAAAPAAETPKEAQATPAAAPKATPKPPTGM